MPYYYIDAPSLPPDPYAAACPPRPDRTHGINKNSPMESNHQNLQKELTQKLSNHQSRFEKSESESSSDVIVTASFDSSFATEESHRGMEISPNDLPPCINDIDYVMEDDKKNNYDEDCIDNIGQYCVGLEAWIVYFVSKYVFDWCR